MTVRFLIVFACVIVAFGPGVHTVAAQLDEAEPQGFEAVRLQQSIQFDGRVDEPAWSEVDPLPLVQHGPTFGAPLSQRTEMRLAYDDNYLYVSARCYDSEPITVATYKRDEWDDEND